MCMVRTNRVQYHTCMACFSVQYAYGYIVPYVSHSIKLSIRTGSSIPKAYYSKTSPECYMFITANVS